jgi:hypothetical protein
MPWIIKDTRDGEYASKFVCTAHLAEVLEADEPEFMEGPWEVDDFTPPPVYRRADLLWCEVEGCNRVVDPDGVEREATEQEQLELAARYGQRLRLVL